jgi:transposase
MARRSFSTELKREAAALVLDQGYSVMEACQAMNVGQTAMRRWVDQLRSERGGKTPESSPALTPEHRRIQELEARIRKLEREKEILKKATALLMSDSLDQPR